MAEIVEWKIQLSELNYDEQERIAVSNVLADEWLTMGAKVNEFEKSFAQFLGNDTECVAVSSATAGLHLILMAIGIEAGDEVILPGLTFVSDGNIIRQLGANPVFADSESTNNFNASVDDIINKITSKTKAIIIVHFAGYPMFLEDLYNHCKSKNIVLIEDVAHAPGSSVKEKKCGTLSDASFFSFFSNKNLAIGEGGMVASHNKKLIQQIRSLRSHGMTSLSIDRHLGRAFSYDVLNVGLNYRIDEMRAALGLVQLSKLISGNKRREQLTKIYRQSFEGSSIEMPFEHYNKNFNCSFHILPILLPKTCDRNALMGHLKLEGIQSSIHYPPFYSFSAYSNLIRRGDLPIADEICERELTLPLHPRLEDEQVNIVANSVKDFCNAA